MNSTLTILLVDDECAIRTLVRDCLEHAGYTVLVAADGVEGVNIFKQHQSDIALLITDVMMPNMNGLALADRGLELESRLPVLFISGDALNTDRGYGCVAKPFTSAGLVGRVRHVFGTTRRRTDNKQQPRPPDNQENQSCL